MKKVLERLKLTRAPNLSDQIATYLARQIDDDLIKSGDVLPSESELAVRFDVSRTVIREALARLKYEGLLVSRQGSRSVIAERGKQRVFRLDRFAINNLSEVGYLYEFRAILETEAGALAAKRRNPSHLRAMRRNLEIMEKAVLRGEDATDSNIDFHTEIVRASGNPYLSDFMEFFGSKIWKLVQSDRNMQKKRGLPSDVQKEHHAIYAAIEKRDSEQAYEELLKHFRNAAMRRGASIFDMKKDERSRS